MTQSQQTRIRGSSIEAEDEERRRWCPRTLATFAAFPSVGKGIGAKGPVKKEGQKRRRQALLKAEKGELADLRDILAEATEIEFDHQGRTHASVSSIICGVAKVPLLPQRLSDLAVLHEHIGRLFRGLAWAMKMTGRGF